MLRYKVKFYEGWYKTRQKKANKDGAICYVEHHLNSIGNDSSINYGMVIVATNASERGKSWAKKYCEGLSLLFEIPLYNRHGMNIGGFDLRGNNNLLFTSMPAILVEPFFLTNQEIQKQLSKDFHLTVSKLGAVLAMSIIDQFPEGGLVAFSVGHKGKPKPSDKDLGKVISFELPRSLSWFYKIWNKIGGSSELTRKYYFAEAEISELAMLRAKTILEGV